ncbi:MAG: hypothetical protein AAF585_09570 [Verrucomicrobiota bacterium]
MSEFPENAFQPKPGKLGQLIYENPDRGVTPRLEFSIEAPFEPFEIEDEEVETALLLSGIRISGSCWRELAGVAADVSLADGAVRLFGVQNPVEVSSLTFGDLSGTAIDVRLDCEIDFEMEGNDEYGIHSLTIETKLEIGPLRIATSMNKRLEGDGAAIAEQLNGVVNLSAHGPIEKAPGGLEYPLLDQSL